MKVEGSAPVWSVTPPSWRFDISIEEDLIEEVARLYGFDNIPEKNEIAAQRMQPWTEARVRNERASDLLVDRGYQEAITYSFTDPATQALLFPGEAFALANPISADLAVMRVSLWPGLLQALGSNQRRQQMRVRLFEIGRRYSGTDGKETEVIAGVVAGSTLPEQWGAEATKVDFFDVKADVEALLGLTGAAARISLRAGDASALHPGQSARIWRGDRSVGWLGALHPEHSRRLDLTYPVFVFELETQSGSAHDVPEFREISKYPAIRRDIAVIVDEALPVETLWPCVRDERRRAFASSDRALCLPRATVRERQEKHSLRLQLQDTSRTLTDNEADALVAQVIEQLGLKLNATIRDK